MHIKVQGAWKGSVEVTDGGTVAELRAAIASVANLPAANVKLLCGGK
jgi:hypothetical protein